MKNKFLISIKRILIIVFLFLFTSNLVTSQSIKGPWVSIPNMPTARWFPATTVVDDKIYVIGGEASPTAAPYRMVEVYNTTTETWGVRTSMPTPRAQLSACTLNGKIYVIGGSSGPTTGWSPVPNNDIYDIVTNTWSKGKDMPNPRAELSLVAVQNKIYAIGGIDGGSTGSKSVDIYDPATDTWSKGANMPTARGTMPACELNGKIYVFGGSNGGASAWNNYATLEVYDINTDSWSTKKEMPESRSHLTGCVLNNKIFAIGGSKVDAGVSYATMFSYNPISNKWENEPSMITAREAFCAVVVKGKIYAIGGTQVQNGLVAFSDAEVFDTVPQVVISNREMRLPTNKASFIGKLFVPGSGNLKFTYSKNDTLYDGALFELRNDSIFTTQDFELNSKKEYQFELLAISENKDSLTTVVKLKTYFKVNATFTAPNGFLLESSGKKVMLDVLAAKEQLNGFIANSDTIWKNMKNGVEPFNNIDLIYTSHAHPCHFDAELILNSLKNNPNAISVMGIEAKKAMEKYFAGNTWLEARIFAPDIPSKSYLDTTLAGIKIRLTNIPHGNFSTLGINIILDSMEFVHFDDYNNLKEADYKTIGFTQSAVDVAFIGALLLNDDQNIIKETYRPDNYITVSHIMNISSLYSNYVTKAEQLKAMDYQINIPRWPMEMFSYKKSNNHVFLSKLNSAPRVSRNFKDVSIEKNKTFNIFLPKSSFVETDLDDEIKYSISINNKPLPEWAKYDTIKSNIVLTPTEVKNYTVTITVSDNHLSFSNISFSLKVTDGVSVENLEESSEFKVYPNPTQSVINIESTGVQKSSYSVNLYNMLGEKVYSVAESLTNKITIDLSKYSESVMFLRITRDGKQECHKIIKY